MEWKDNEECIYLRKCDVYAVLHILTLGNTEAIKVACDSLDLQKLE
jgi:hypothetical protein